MEGALEGRYLVIPLEISFISLPIRSRSSSPTEYLSITGYARFLLAFFGRPLFLPVLPLGVLLEVGELNNLPLEFSFRVFFGRSGSPLSGLVNSVSLCAWLMESGVRSFGCGIPFGCKGDDLRVSCGVPSLVSD